MKGDVATTHLGKRWTDAFIRTLPPRSSPYTDPGQTGLQLLVRVKRDGSITRTWLLRFKYKGEEPRMVLGHYPVTTLDAARGLARAAREQASQGIDPRRAGPRRRAVRSPLPLSSAPASGKHSIEWLASEFMELHVKANHKDPAYTQRVLDLDVLTTWTGRDARTIKPREVIELLDGIVARGSKVMANRTGSVLGQMFKFGIHRDTVEVSPVQLLYRPGGKEAPRERCLTDDELTALLANPKDATRFDRLAHVVVILLLTGQRLGELAHARWANIDFKAKTWRIPDEDSKNGKGHVVPLSDWAVAEFEALRRLAHHARHVLPNKAADGPADAKLLTRGMARCQARMKKLGIAAFTLHDLRRTCRTGLSAVKVAPHIAERVLNHKQEKIAGTYDTHDYFDEKKEALDKWATHLRSLIP